MENEIEIRRGDVYWIQSDGWGVGDKLGRPAVIMSSDIHNERSDHVSGFFMTTKEKYGVCNVEVQTPRRPSWVQCDFPMSVRKDRLGNYLYTLTDEELEAVEHGVCVAFSLEPEYREDEGEDNSEEIRGLEEEISSLKAKVADLTNQLSQHKLNNTVREKLYDRAIEEIVSLRFASDVNKAVEARKKVEPKEGTKPAPKDVVGTVDEKVEINTCSEAELKACGCSPTLIHHIVSNRPYKKLEDLKALPFMTRIAYQVLEKKLCCVPVAKPPKVKVEKKPERVNVNTATADELVEIVGLSVSTANNIRAYRNKHGKFTSVEDLLNVPRFGKVCLKKYGQMLEV